MKKLLVIGKVWPEPLSSAAGTRMMQLLEIFSEAGYTLHFASAAQQSEFSDSLSSLNVTCTPIQLNDESFDLYIKELSPDLVLFDRFTSEEQFGWRVAQFCPNAVRLLDTEDLHALRAAREKAMKHHREVTTSDLHSDLMKREIASIYRSDLSLIISNHEMQLLQTHFKIDPKLLCYLPLFAEAPSTSGIATLPPFQERKHFISIGNFLHAPNRDAVHYLKTDIWSLIRKQIPEAELHIYGAYPDEKVFQLQDKKNGFIIKGRAEDAEQVMKSSRVCLAPLRFGAGLKGKLLLAMQCGTPSVTTPVGAESMYTNQEGAALDWPGTISSTPNEIASSAIQNYTDKNLWSKNQTQGFSLLTQLFQKKNHVPRFLQNIKDIETQLEQHRNENFIGSMLNYHTTQSTKYMALWIENKNKLAALGKIQLPSDQFPSK